MQRPEIIDDEAVAESWLRREDGGSDEPRKDRVNHASKIGHPCDRYLVLKRTHGDKATPPSQFLRAIFARGRVLEQPVAVRQLIKHGWRVWDEQRGFDVIEKGEVVLSAHIDCLAKPPDSSNTYVVDHKIVNEHDWAKIPRGYEGYEYLKASEKPWLHAWPAQLTAYMYAHPGAADVGLLQLINATTLLPKFVYVPFDYNYMQELLDRATAVNASAKAVMNYGMRNLPDPIPYDEAVCGRCELRGVCLPDVIANRPPIELIEDGSFIELLQEDRELSRQKGEIEKQYKKVHDRVKFMVGERKELVAGPYWITQQEITIGPKQVKGYSYLRMDIKPLQAEKNEEATA